jgi:cellulose synthase/poly-beta-1,6-N-acetylglucosamine synthase-like glycosyltransferase
VTAAVVAIGRNEGARLKACLESVVAAGVSSIVYVDSGSTDDSVGLAEGAGAHVVRLDMSAPFTAARARNAGLRALLNLTRPEFVQFIDGDCTLEREWLETALQFMRANPGVAVVCGRRRERFPDKSIYNRLCDIEWATPIGEALACGGDALVRTSAIEQVGAYRETLIAGEEPEFCLRLREKGWRIWRLDAEMTRHDAAIARFGQWWKRSRRAGHAFAEVSALHRGSQQAIWGRETLRAVAWSAILPAAIVGAVSVHPASFAITAVYPLQIARVALREQAKLGDHAFAFAVFSTLGKFAEATGVIGYWWSQLVRRPTRLVEYK